MPIFKENSRNFLIFCIVKKFQSQISSRYFQKNDRVRWGSGTEYRRKGELGMQNLDSYIAIRILIQSPLSPFFTVSFLRCV